MLIALQHSALYQIPPQPQALGIVDPGAMTYNPDFSSDRHLLIATRNIFKLKELRDLLGCRGRLVIGAGELPGLPPVEEDGETFEVNARKKARVLSAAAGLWTLADDSGLEVDALGGAPGVRSARFAGGHGDDAANNRRLLGLMQGLADRRARFRCVLALCSPSGECRTVEGVCQGRIIDRPRGHAGFGYDPLFVPEGGNRTFAELSAVEKNRLSHRGRALRRALEQWADVLCRG